MKHNTKKLTKVQLRIIENYKNSHITTLEQAYKTCSSAKQQSYRDIYEEMLLNKGFGIRILSANTFQYTCAYITDLEECTLVYHTASKKVVIPLTEEMIAEIY